MKYRWIGIVGAGVLVGTLFPTFFVAQTAQTQTEQAPATYARIAIMRAMDGHSVDWEAGYIRHLEWHRQAKDAFGWYSYSVWASTERQRWILYATFGHTAAELSNPVSPAEDERDNLINVLPHAQFLGNGIYEFLPALSRGNGVPTPTLRAEYTTVELNPRASLAAILDERAEQALPGKVDGLISKLTVETLVLRPNMLVNVTPEPAR
jgi:hypothetical protein